MKEINIIDFGLMGKQISALFYLLGYEICRRKNKM